MKNKDLGAALTRNDDDMQLESFNLSEDEKMVRLQKYIKKIIELVDPDPNREGMKKTPKRYSEALIELTKGNTIDFDKVINNAIFDAEGYNDMIIIKNLSYNSMCEHHLMPFFGEITIGYIPKDKILGLSKFPRIVDCLSKKFTLQEKLTMDIADLIQKTLNPEGLVVTATGVHSCMCFRGIKASGSQTNTIYSFGSLKKSEIMDYFLKLSQK